LQIKNVIYKVIFLSIIIIISNCQKDPSNKTINIFSIEDDKKLGLQVKQEIERDTVNYKILNETKYPEAYSHINRIVTNILNSGKVFYKNDFAWETKILVDDSTLNAFCVPGGYLYIYTGLIKYLDSEDQVAGVMAHEIAHADRRHATEILTKQYGISVLLEVVLGKNQGLLSEIGSSLLTLSFSRENEYEADEYSVKYLCPTEYNSAGAAAFFEKLLAANQVGHTPAFLSTHPDPGNRVEKIKELKTSFNCQGDSTFTQRYIAFKQSLP